LPLPLLDYFNLRLILILSELQCRWLHRATWVQTELFLTFPSPAVKSITLIPLNSPETAGRFRVWLQHTLPDADSGGEPNGGKGSQEITTTLLHDRKIQGGFPELKQLKQRIRDIIQPGLSLGHSDKK